VHRIWRIAEPAAVRTIVRTLARKPVFIADGHHRFEVAKHFRGEQRKRRRKLRGEASDYMLAYFTNALSRGLLILPFHRVLQGLQPEKMALLETRLKDLFDITRVTSRSRLLALLAKSRGRHAFGRYERGKRFSLLILKRGRNFATIQDSRHSRVYRNLDVAVLNRLVIEGALGLALRDAEHLVYTPDLDRGINLVDSGTAQTMFIVNPLALSELVSVASRGERMPPKSTYFYPKLLSGLLINQL
jgi:uncharacterized protein (DUF1015 family)